MGTSMLIRVSALLLLVGGVVHGQEIKYIDLSVVHQRTELRSPQAPPSNYETGNGVGAGYVGASISDGAPDHRDPHALGIYLLRINPTNIDPTEPFEVEFRVLNTGLDSIEIPVFPHLSDLQPLGEFVDFSYISLALVVRVEGVLQSDVPSIGFVELYGSPDQKGTTVLLKPGEWIRVRANIKFRFRTSKSTPANLRGEFWLRRNTVHPRVVGGFTETQNLYPNTTATPAMPVHLIVTSPFAQSK